MAKRSFADMKEAVDDLESWHATMAAGDGSPFHQIEPIRDAEHFTGFSARVRRHSMDQMYTQLVEVRTSEHAIRRTAEHTRADPELDYLLHFQLSGSSMFQQGGSPIARMRPGDYTVTTTHSPYRMEFVHGDHSLFTLRFPASFIDLPEQLVQPVTGRPLPSTDGFGRYLAPFVSSVARDAELLRGPVGGRVARNLIDLFATGVVELIDSDPLGHGSPLFLQVTDYIARHLADPGLEVGSIARASHISVRSLQALFQDQGTTVTDWIRERRLEGCRRDLANPALREAAIGEIAHRWGYQDQAYFSRLFRRSFDETPREWRARAGAVRLAS